jgi:UDP:flavonoid glycosyltransferase YjiC (YdhE family)
VSGGFLFVSWDGSGNLPPTLAAARTLAARGHDVRLLGHEAQRELVDLPLTPYRTVPDLYERRPPPPEEVWWDELFLDERPGIELADELERAPADAVVVDCLLWGALAAAERLRVAAVVFVHSLYAPRFAAEDLPARRERLSRTRAAFELPPVGSLLEPWSRAALVLVASTRSLDRPPEPLPANVVYAGPLRPRDGSRTDLPWRPDVVVSLSTAPLPMPRTTQRVLDALAPLPVRCLVTSSANGLRPGANTLVRAWVPHDAVLPGASLVVTQAGHGTVTAALSHGVPLLCLPTVADQPFVAEAVVAAGAGLSLPPGAAVEELRAAAEEILAEPRYREAAHRLGREIARELADEAWLGRLEALVG